jgi:hypothetical protein
MGGGDFDDSPPPHPLLEIFHKNRNLRGGLNCDGAGLPWDTDA